MRVYWGRAGLALLICCAAFPALAQVTTTYTYDAQGQVKTVTRANQTVTYTYDAAANRTQLSATTPLAGRAATQPASTATGAASAEQSGSTPVSGMPVPPPLPAPLPFSPLASQTPGVATSASEPK